LVWVGTPFGGKGGEKRGGKGVVWGWGGGGGVHSVEVENR